MTMTDATTMGAFVTHFLIDLLASFYSTHRPVFERHKVGLDDLDGLLFGYVEPNDQIVSLAVELFGGTEDFWLGFIRMDRK
jgi:hypothetical protein